MLSIYAILAACLVVEGAQACSVDGKLPPEHTMEETLYRADVVVYGRSSATPVKPESPWTDYPVTLEVHCVLKGPALANTTLVLDWDYYHTCAGDWPELDKSYIAAVMPTKNGTKWAMDEPGTWEDAAFEATAENIQRALKLCKMDPKPQGSDGTCPQSSTTTGECVNAVYDNAVVPAVSASTFLLALIVSALVGY